MFEYIWCPTCEAIVVLAVCDMPAWGRNTHQAQDLLCSSCGFVIATLHESQSPLRL